MPEMGKKHVHNKNKTEHKIEEVKEESPCDKKLHEHVHKLEERIKKIEEDLDY